MKGIDVVGTDRCIFSGSAKGVMQFLLSSNESFIGFVVETYVSEDSGCHEGTDLFDLDINSPTEGSTVMVVVGAERVIEGHLAFWR